jgi:hypothetical protein
MAPRRGPRAGILLPLMLIANVALGLPSGSRRVPGRQDGKRGKWPCSKAGCPGTMKRKGDYYVCDKDSSHKVHRGLD